MILWLAWFGVLFWVSLLVLCLVLEQMAYNATRAERQYYRREFARRGMPWREDRPAIERMVIGVRRWWRARHA